MKVKVPVALVISSLTKKLENNKEITKRNQVVRDELAVANKAWAEQIKKLDLPLDEVSAHTWRDTITLTYKIVDKNLIPAEPRLGDLESELGSYEIQEIESALRILSMSEDTYVSASVMKEIGKYL